MLTHSITHKDCSFLTVLSCQSSLFHVLFFVLFSVFFYNKEPSNRSKLFLVVQGKVRKLLKTIRPKETFMVRKKEKEKKKKPMYHFFILS